MRVPPTRQHWTFWPFRVWLRWELLRLGVLLRWGQWLSGVAGRGGLGCESAATHSPPPRPELAALGGPMGNATCRTWS